MQNILYQQQWKPTGNCNRWNEQQTFEAEHKCNCELVLAACTVCCARSSFNLRTAKRCSQIVIRWIFFTGQTKRANRYEWVCVTYLFFGLFALSTVPILWSNWVNGHRNNAQRKKRERKKKDTLKIKHTKNQLDISLIYFAACSDLCSLWK